MVFEKQWLIFPLVKLGVTDDLNTDCAQFSIGTPGRPEIVLFDAARLVTGQGIIQP